MQAIDAADAKAALGDEARDVEPDLLVAPGALAGSEGPELPGVVRKAAPHEHVPRPVPFTAALELHAGFFPLQLKNPFGGSLHTACVSVHAPSSGIQSRRPHSEHFRDSEP